MYCSAWNMFWNCSWKAYFRYIIRFMKNLRLVSFVGVDESTNFEDLKTFSNINRIYEFGILHSNSRNGKDKRYPSHEFTKKYLEWAKNNEIYSSLHLCGASIDKFLKEDEQIMQLSRLAGRIQLNLNIKKYLDYEDLANKIIYVADKYKFGIILQYNNSKKKFNELFLSKIFNFNLSLLNDSSGGFGRKIKIEKINMPHPKYFTGYAGGICLDNVLDVIEWIENVNKNNKYYIDMESGIRENNIFSIEKCKAIYKLIELKKFC